MQLGLGSYAFRWAIGTADFTPPEPLRVVDLIDATAASGLELLQVVDSRELDAATDAELHVIRDRAAERGIRLQTGTSGLTEDRLSRAIHIAALLGSDLIRLVLDGPGGNPSVEESVRVLTDALPRLAEADATVAIENHFMTPSDQLLAVVTAVGSPRVGVCLDTANSIMVAEWPSHTIRLLAPHALCLHLKDYRVEPDRAGVGGHVIGVPLGEGWLDVGATLEAMAGADGRQAGRLAVILEQWLPAVSDPAATVGAEREAREDAVVRARHYLGAERPTSRV